MKKGFTLAELMAVVVIIAIIASIGLGGYRRTVEKAKLSEGINMGHQIAAALARADYDRTGRCGSFNTPWTQLDINVSDPDSAMAASSLELDNRFLIFQYGQDIMVSRKGNSNTYTIRIPIDCGTSNTRLKDSCEGNEEFCISAGYTNCNAFASCTKP